MTQTRRRGNGNGTLFRRRERGNWHISYFDATGKRRTVSTRTTDRRAAERILAKKVSDAALRRSGVIDIKQDRLSAASHQPLAEHLDAYVRHCEVAGQDPKHIHVKRSLLNGWFDSAGATRLSDLTADALVTRMRKMVNEGLSLRTANHLRQTAIAFVRWCIDNGTLAENPLDRVKKFDEVRDRRRRRRALKDDEIERLFEVATEHGRLGWYMAAYYAGLRRGDLVRLRWSDIDFDRGTITITEGKARREDVVPLHPRLAKVLLEIREQQASDPYPEVFPTKVTTNTQRNDFFRAGLATKVPVVDDAGKPVLVGRGRRRRQKMKIVLEDESGRRVDLHALRATLGTRLALQGVAPAITQKIMRHADYRTTQKHYQDISLADTTSALTNLPGGEDEDQPGCASDDPPARQRYRQQREHDSVREGATQANQEAAEPATNQERKSSQNNGLCGDEPRCAKICESSAGVTQLVECQLPKLNVEGSSPFARFSAFAAISSRASPASSQASEATAVAV